MSLTLASNAIDATADPLPQQIDREVGQSVVFTFSADPGGGNAALNGAGALPSGLSVAPESDFDESGGAIVAGSTALLVIQCEQAGQYVLLVGDQPIALTVTEAATGRVFTRRVYSVKVYDARVFAPAVYGPAVTQ